MVIEDVWSINSKLFKVRSPNIRAFVTVVDSLLHLFGKWLFEAAYIDTAFSATATDSAEKVIGSMAAAAAAAEPRSSGPSGDHPTPAPPTPTPTPPPALLLPHAAPPPYPYGEQPHQPHQPSALQ